MDIKTLILALALGNLSLVAALFFFEYDRKKPSSLSTWAMAKQCQAAAWLLLYAREALPELVTVLLVNGLLFTGMALDAEALWQSCGRPLWRRYLLPALGLALAGLLFVSLGGVASPLRLALGALIVSAFFLIGVLALARTWRSATMLRRFLVVCMFGLSLVVALRGVQALLWPETDSWLSAALLQSLGFAALYLMMLTNAFGYLLLSREQLQDELARLEVVDPLTAVPNRRGFYQALTPWMALARRPGMPTALIVLKLDDFKRVNDSYGHPVGDAVLKTMVEVCQRQLRDSDLMGRLGGAEFAIQLPRTAAADALQVAERIRKAIEAMPVKAERAVINLTASLGVTCIRAEDSTVSLFKRADEALQLAKQQGRNRVVEAPSASPLDV